MSKKISVIVPCYNVENYIDRCIKSIVNQTIGIENLEVIFVNDASTDNTLCKLQKWESRYPDDIMVITYDENLKQGGARNLGLQYASCEYIGFIDSDDWAELDMYETLLRPMEQGNYDRVLGKFVRSKSEDESMPDSKNREDKKYIFSESNGIYFCDISDYGHVGEAGGVYTGLYKKDVIIKNGVFFPEKISYEDNYWGAVLQMYLKDTYVVDKVVYKVVYHYFVNENSTVASRNVMHHFDRLAIEVGILEEYKARGGYELYKEYLEWRFIHMYYINTLYIIFTCFDYIPDIFNDMKDTVLSYFPRFRDNKLIKERETGRKELLLRLLDFPEHLTMDDLERVKYAYLKSLYA